jgi:hypothetical protein
VTVASDLAELTAGTAHRLSESVLIRAQCNRSPSFAGSLAASAQGYGAPAR